MQAHLDTKPCNQKVKSKTHIKYEEKASVFLSDGAIRDNNLWKYMGQ